MHARAAGLVRRVRARTWEDKPRPERTWPCHRRHEALHKSYRPASRSAYLWQGETTGLLEAGRRRLQVRAQASGGLEGSSGARADTAGSARADRDVGDARPSPAGAWPSCPWDGPLEALLLQENSEQNVSKLERLYEAARSEFHSGHPIIHDEIYDRIERMLKHLGSPLTRKYPRWETLPACPPHWPVGGW